jgi:hypothetical protein
MVRDDTGVNPTQGTNKYDGDDRNDAGFEERWALSVVTTPNVPVLLVGTNHPHTNVDVYINTYGDPNLGGATINIYAKTVDAGRYLVNSFAGAVAVTQATQRFSSSAAADGFDVEIVSGLASTPGTPQIACTAIAYGWEGTCCSGGGAPVASTTNVIIFRPGGVAGGNVYTTWATTMAQVAAVHGAATVRVDDSIVSPAPVPAGTWDGETAALLAGYAPDQNTLELADGAVLKNWIGVRALDVLCDCVTTSAFTFSPNQAFELLDFGSIFLNTGALVPAIAIAGGLGFGFAMIARMGSLDNSLAPTVATLFIGAGTTATLYVQCNGFNFSFLDTGNEIGGAVGSTVIYEHDDTNPDLVSTLMLGTTVNSRTSTVTSASSGSAALGTVATADGAGGITWSPVGASSELDGIVFRPGGVAGGNVYTTWATAFAAALATNDTTTIYVDSSMAPATVPAGAWNGQGVLTLAAFNVGLDALAVDDGGTLEELQAIEGLQVDCACVTTAALTIANGASLYLSRYSKIVLQVGALVPALQVAAGVVVALELDSGALDNTNAPTVGVVNVTNGGALVCTNMTAEFSTSPLTTGNEISGIAGAFVAWDRPDVVPPMTSTLYHGTVADGPADPHIGSDGTPAAPPYSFVAAPGTGMYRDAGTGDLRFAVLGNYVSGFDAYGTLYGFQNASMGPVGVPFTLGEGPGSDSTWLFVGSNIGTGFTSLTSLRASDTQTWLNAPTSGLGFALHLQVAGADFIQCGGAAGTPDQVCIAVQGSSNLAIFTSLYSTDFFPGEQIIGILNAVTNVNPQSSLNKGAGYLWTDTRTDGEPQGLVFCGTGGAGGLGNGARSAVAPCGLGSHNTQAGDEICERAYGRTGPIVIGGGNAITMTIPLENGSFRGKVSILGRLVTVGTSGTVGDTYYSTWDLRLRTIAGVVTVDFFALDAAASSGSQASMLGAIISAVGVGSDVEITIDASAIGAGSGSVEDWQTDLYKCFID